MTSLTPMAAELVDYYDDGEAARHFQFRLLDQHQWPAPEPGQFFMLSVPGAGEIPLTFTRLPDQNQHWWALVRRMRSVTSALFQLGPGAIVGARGPFGRGWPMPVSDQTPVLLIAGGCGLAPLVSQADRLLAANLGPVALIYGARSPEARVLGRERHRWQGKLALFEVIEQSPGQETRRTPLDALPDLLARWGYEPGATFMCGPEAMMTALGQCLIERDTPPSSIWLSLERRMHCATGTCGHCYLSHRYVCQSGPTFGWPELELLMQQTVTTQSLPLLSC